MNFITRQPLIAAPIVTLISLMSGGGMVVMADFGASLWGFLPLLVWLGTIGLPSTVGVVIAATCWGRVPAMTGFLPFAALAAALALTLQTSFFVMFSKASRRRAP